MRWLTRRVPFRSVMDDERGWTHARLGASLIWLVFILFPLFNAVGGGGPVLGHILAILAAALFVLTYVTLVVSWRREPPSWLTAALVAVMLGLAAGLTLVDYHGWSFLFVYCAACCALLAEPNLGFAGVLLCTGLGAGLAAVSGASGDNIISVSTSSAGVGLLMLMMRGLRVRNAELSAARAELARLAVAEERERFARDLHDLLGHTLSVIALKAELAGRLLPERPEEAAGEVADLERVARAALSEVRETVSGYRQPTLEGELAGAKMALAAAGIELEVRTESESVDPAAEGVLAWAVREGATNVIRHSGARRCRIVLGSVPGEDSIEILDDGASAGAGTDGGGAGAGHGLLGLRERALAAGGRLEAGPVPGPGTGFRLQLRVPAGSSARSPAAVSPASAGSPAPPA